MTGRSQPLPWWLGGRRVKGDRKQNASALLVIGVFHLQALNQRTFCPVSSPTCTGNCGRVVPMAISRSNQNRIPFLGLRKLAREESQKPQLKRRLSQRTPPPRIWAHIRGRYWSAKIEDISLRPPARYLPNPLFHRLTRLQLMKMLANEIKEFSNPYARVNIQKDLANVYCLLFLCNIC